MLRAPLASRKVRPAGVASARPSRYETISVTWSAMSPSAAGQDLLFAAGVVKANQAVGGRDVDGSGFRIRKDAVHTEDVLVFDVLERGYCRSSEDRVRDRSSRPRDVPRRQRPGQKCCGRSSTRGPACSTRCQPKA